MRIKSTASASRRKRGASLSAYGFILPSFFFLVCFHVVPIIMTMYYSLTNYNAVQAPDFVGLANYQKLLSDPYVKASLFNTVIYTLVVVPLQTILSMVIAYVLARVTRNWWGQFVRSSMFIPVVASMILVTSIWRIMLSANSGVINEVLEFFGLSAVNWLGQRWPALLSVCMIGIWKNTGYFLVIYYAGMMDVPVSLYEAAEVDGANAFQQFFMITIPMLRSITYLVITLGTIWSFQVFDLVYTLTGGGPGRSTVTLVLTVYTSAFKDYKMGYASAIATLLLGLVMLVSVIQRVLMSREKGDAA